MTDAAASGPLGGLRVLDLGHYYAGPMAAMLLADQGADVVRVMRPEGPEVAGPRHRVLNRNKRLVTLDFTTAAGRERARELAIRADVVIESYRPGVMARHGLDHASLADENPGLIHLSLPGFASHDTERAGLQAWEGVVSAAASLFNTELRSRLNFPPLPIPAPICSAFASMHGAIATVSALIARERGLGGARIEVPLVNAGLSTCTRSFVYDGGRLRADADADGPSDLPPPVAALALRPEDDDATRAEKLAGLAGLAPPIFTTHPYRSADGRRLMLMPIKPEMATRFFSILGLERPLRLEGFVIESPWERIDLGEGNNLASSWTLSRERSLRVIECVQQRIERESADHWQATFAAAGIPVAYLRTREEWMRDPSVAAAGLVTEMNDGRTPLEVSGAVADVTDRDGNRREFVAREPEPVAAEAIGELFAAGTPGSTDSPGREGSNAPVRKGDLLAGIHVLDLCNVVAGPNAAYTLAQFGADVVRVEPPRSFNLPMHLEWTLEVNQGKRSAILDVGTAPGREAFARLVRWADVVVHNRLDDVAERLGMSPSQLQSINPEVVVCQNSAFGGSVASAWDAVPGYDPMPNLTTGLDAAAGSAEAPRPMTEIFADLMGGLGTGFASVLGLYQREKTGVAGVGRSSLARGAHHYQLTELIDGDDASSAEAQDVWWQRLYACRDGWIFVGARADRRAELARSVTGRDDATGPELETVIREKDVAHWLETFAADDIGCHRVLDLGDLLDDPRPVDNEPADECANGPLEILRWSAHPSGLPILLPAPAWVQIGHDRSYRRLTPTARVGAHTRDVLRELGYDASEIDRLFALRVAHDFLPAIGSPDAFFHQPERPRDE